MTVGIIKKNREEIELLHMGPDKLEKYFKK
jgi:hypothetical protein